MVEIKTLFMCIYRGPYTKRTDEETTEGVKEKGEYGY